MKVDVLGVRHRPPPPLGLWVQITCRGDNTSILKEKVLEYQLICICYVNHVMGPMWWWKSYVVMSQYHSRGYWWNTNKNHIEYRTSFDLVMMVLISVCVLILWRNILPSPPPPIVFIIDCKVVNKHLIKRDNTHVATSVNMLLHFQIGLSLYVIPI